MYLVPLNPDTLFVHSVLRYPRGFVQVSEIIKSECNCFRLTFQILMIVPSTHVKMEEHVMTGLILTPAPVPLVGLVLIARQVRLDGLIARQVRLDGLIVRQVRLDGLIARQVCLDGLIVRQVRLDGLIVR